MKDSELIRVDGIKWWETKDRNNDRLMVPICPQHHIRLTPVIIYDTYYGGVRGTQKKPKPFTESRQLKCEEDGHIFDLPRKFGEERHFAINKKDAVPFSKMKTLNLDDEAIYVAKEELKESDYWVRAKVTKTKSGTRLIVWAGNKSKKNKTQLFVEPEIQRMSFDQNDNHPLEVFAKVEATFIDDIKSTIKKDGQS